MFRELGKKNKKLPDETCVNLLKKETRGVLSVQGDDGYPYGMPMNHFYNEEDGAVYFHCGNTGHRLDALRKNDKVSFCVYDRGVKAPGDWAYTVNSVVVFGRIEICDDPALIRDIATQMSLKFTQDMEYIQKEIEEHGYRTLLLKLVPEHICGKKVHEA